MQETVEIATFRLSQHIDPLEFLDANASVNHWLQRQPGFLARQLVLREDHSWLDVIRWKSSQDARRAAQASMAELAECSCMRMIAPESVNMTQSLLHLSA